jgi:hypothetical protein
LLRAPVGPQRHYLSRARQVHYGRPYQPRWPRAEPENTSRAAGMRLQCRARRLEDLGYPVLQASPRRQNLSRPSCAEERRHFLICMLSRMSPH